MKKIKTFLEYFWKIYFQKKFLFCVLPLLHAKNKQNKNKIPSE